MNIFMLHKFLGIFFILGLFSRLNETAFFVCLFLFCLSYKYLNEVFYKVIFYFALGLLRNISIQEKNTDYTYKTTNYKAKIKDYKIIDNEIYLIISDIVEYSFKSNQYIVEEYVDLPQNAIVKIKNNTLKEVRINSEITAVGRFYPPIQEILLEKKEQYKVKGIIYDYEIKLSDKITFKDKLRKKMSYLSPNAKKLCLAIFIGDTFSIDQDLREIFSLSGLAHILGVSVLNIAILFYIFYKFFYIILKKYFINLSYHMPLQQISQIGSLICVFLYCYILGFDYPLLRSLTISVINLFSMFIGKKRKEETLFISAAVILCIFPDAIFDIGFQLSFSSVLMIYSFQTYIKNKFLSNIYITCTTVIGTFPIAVYNFHKLCMQPILGNVLIIPYFSFVIIPIMNLWLALSVFNIEWLLNDLINLLFYILIVCVKFLSNFSYYQYFPILHYKIVFIYIMLFSINSVFKNLYLFITSYLLIFFNMFYSYKQNNFVIVHT